MSKTRKKRMYGFGCVRFVLIAAAVVMLMGICNTAAAFQIPTGDEDVGIRWDNTFRYNYGVRVHNPDSAIILNPNMDDGDRNFNKGTVTNRLDILSEFDFVYMKTYGVRFSGAFWYDQRYHDPMGNDSVLTSNHLENGQSALGFSNATKKYHRGPDGELLDAFAFGKFDLGPVPLNIKAGRHTVYWGESLMLGGAINGISYSQMPIDAAKGYATPGTEAKELFRPLFNISASAQLTNTFSISGQYFLQWESYRFPEAGSYLGSGDMILKGGESLIVVPGIFSFRHGSDVEPNGRKDWGVAAQWSPEWLGGKIGLYYRKFSDKLPAVHINLFTGQYFAAYADGIDLYGVSLAKQILGVSVGFEYSMRHNMPLVGDAPMIGPYPGMLPAPPSEGDTFGVRGDTQHALINCMGLLGKTPLFNSAVWIAEVTYSRWDKVTQGEQYFKGRDGYDQLDRVSKDAVGASVSFTPTWYQVFPGMDLSMPLSYSRGLSGNAAFTFGDQKNGANLGVGLSLDVFQKYSFALAYTKYYGDYDTDATGAMSLNTGSAGLSDRDWVSFTFKFTL